MSEWLSIYWIAPLVAWVVAQVAKVAYAYAKGASGESRPTFISSGNMPSSHSAISVALLVVVGALNGVNSAIFGLTAVFTSIVIYDALNVRRAVGEQGLVLKVIVKDRSFYRAMGHKPTEVVVGAIIGMAVAFVMLQIL